MVGLWKFRPWDRDEGWACTYVVEGTYYDTLPKPTPDAALNEVYRVLRRLKKL